MDKLLHPLCFGAAYRLDCGEQRIFSTVNAGDCGEIAVVLEETIHQYPKLLSVLKSVWEFRPKGGKSHRSWGVHRVFSPRIGKVGEPSEGLPLCNYQVFDSIGGQVPHFRIGFERL